MTMFTRTVAIVVCLGVAATGCASASGARIARAPEAPLQDRTVLADYVQRIAIGSKVRVERASGQAVRGTLMKATADSIIVQRNTRVPEQPLDIPLSDVARVSLDGDSSPGRSIGIGIAAGSASALGVFLTLLALFARGG
jgi:hypothetical protein